MPRHAVFVLVPILLLLVLVFLDRTHEPLTDELELLLPLSMGSLSDGLPLQGLDALLQLYGLLTGLLHLGIELLVLRVVAGLHIVEKRLMKTGNLIDVI